MAKKKALAYDPVIPRPTCGGCGQRIDREQLANALKHGTRYVHQCGRVLLKGKNS